MPWLIYKHTNKINGKVYIGQTKQSPTSRWKNGLGYSDKHNSVFSRAIKKYGWNNFDHEIIEENISSQEQANLREIFWIKHFNSYIGFDNTNGYNMTLGGDSGEHLGYPVYQIDKKTLEIVKEFASTSEASRSFGNGEGNASHIRNCCDGKKPSCKGYFWCYVKNYSISWKPKDNKLVSSVYQIDDDLEIIRKFDSITDAVKNGFSGGSIVQCCQRKTRRANGFYWCYCDDYNNSWKPTETKFLMNEKIYCIELKKVFKNSAEAAKEMKLNRGSILKCCSHRELNAVNGFHFCFYKDRHSYVIRNNQDESPVVCINTGIHYKTVASASRDTGASYSSISGCCRGKYKTAKGLTFVYENDYKEGLQTNKTKEKSIICVETGKEYKSTMDACRELNISHGLMGEALKSHSTAKGLHFCYKEEKNSWQPAQDKRYKKIICVESGTEYKSAAEAERLTTIKRGNIFAALKSGGKAGGYHWRYADGKDE